ncbi:unnamed protein product [Darwinula stevensoni]|uniref:Potassium channel domain-containing protein n=1 Tax=Darwinula stevensoni TaxID=69355 RepID=A0A7R8XFE8_9CRUS|nr:unnamed protein product [Darwinula stevensoni]CAG0894948.1 unnamed protein product [Darwinula stevensoni]
MKSSNNDTRLMVVKELRRACKDTETLESPVVSLGFFPYLYFTLTVVTTIDRGLTGGRPGVAIGYGNVIPRSTGGRLFCMVYALIGIPLTGMLLAALGDAFSGFMLRHFESKIISRFGRHKRYGVAVATVAYLMIGFVLFLFVPAGIFTVIEGWTYLEALYYAVVTLTTIGFGDFVTAQEGDASWLWFYQVAVIVWIVMGLGYWVTVVTFTTKALRKLHLPDVNAQARMALQQLGILSRDPEFLRKHSIVTMEMMAQLASAVTGERVAGPSENTVASAGVAGAFARGQGAGLPSLFRLPIGGSSPVGGAYQPAPREDDEEGNRGESEREPL